MTDEPDHLSILNKMMNTQKCGACGQQPERQVKETKRQIKVIARHLCTVMNGICKVEKNYIKRNIK